MKPLRPTRINRQHKMHSKSLPNTTNSIGISMSLCLLAGNEKSEAGRSRTAHMLLELENMDFLFGNSHFERELEEVDSLNGNYNQNNVKSLLGKVSNGNSYPNDNEIRSLTGNG